MATVPWEITHSVETNEVLLSLALLDRYRQLGRPAAEFELYGRSLPVRTEPRVAGAGAATLVPPRGHSAQRSTIELSLDGAGTVV